MNDIEMADNYDFSKSVKVPYQTLINLFLTQCAREHRKLSVTWN